MASLRSGRSRRAPHLLACLGCLVLISSSQTVSAQITTATVSGTVHDESGGVLPGTTVVVTNQDTGIARTATTGAEGRYQVTNLSPGKYAVRAELSGFQPRLQQDLSLTVGMHAVVDMALKLGEVSEEVLVTGGIPLVDTQTSTIAGIVEETQIRELPLNLRSYEQLATLQPGVTSGNARVGVRGGAGTQLYIAGARSEYNEFQIDNVEAGDTWGKTPGGMSGGVLGVESIKEFSVLTSSYSAEYGKAAGGVVNVITRAGTNKWDGSSYLFHRNEALDAKDFFDITKPDFKRNQYGASMGGPILRDKTFFFVNYEGLRQDRPETRTGLVPTAAARQGILPGRIVSVNPAVVPYLNLWPLPNGADHGDGTADFRVVRTEKTVADYVLWRVDHQMGANHSLTARHIFEDGYRNSPNTVLDGQTGTLEGKKHNLSLQYQTILSPRLINEFRFGFNRSIQNDYDLFEGISPDLNFIPLEGRVLGNLAVTGLSGYGHAGSQPLFFNYDNYQFINHLTFNTGNHSIRMGGDIRRTHLDAMNVAALHGVYQFDNLERLLLGQARFFRFLLPGAGRDEAFAIRQSLFGFYVQDDWKMRSNLTINMGLRYEFITVPTEVDGKVANLRNILDTRTVIGDPMFKNPSLKNFGPRLGFAWDPWGTGTTSVRGGVGVFFSPIDTTYLHDTVFRVPPFFVRPEVTPAVFPNQYDVTVAGRDLETLDIYQLGEVFIFKQIPFEFENPFMLNYQASVQRQLLADTVLTVGYVGSRGYHLAREVDINTPVYTRRADGRVVFPSSGPRLNPGWGTVAQKRFDANSYYHSLQLSLRQRLNRGLLFQGAYTLSRSIDDASGSTQGGDGFANSNTNTFLPDDRFYDRGYSDFDRRHVFASSAVWELPIGPGKAWGSSLSGFAEKVLVGWQLGGTVALRSGGHTSVFLSPDRARTLHGGIGFAQRPDLVAGADPNPIDPGNPNQYIGRESFAIPEQFVLGNLPRNTITLPGVASVDMSLTKMTPVGGDVRLQFRAEVFNALNRTHFGTPNLTVFGGTAAAPTPSPTFGRITSTSISARQVQLGIKVIF